MARRPIRIIVAKGGMDGHDRGARVVARALRDAGMEVIYTGRHVSIEAIARTARDEDADVVGLSVLSGAHRTLCLALLEQLERLGIRDDIKVVIGGTIATRAERDELLAIGVDDVFPGATPLTDIVVRIQQLAADLWAQRANATAEAGRARP
jgi:methylmalonyl-CoA mutase, C-terminal domain